MKRIALLLAFVAVNALAVATPVKAGLDYEWVIDPSSGEEKLACVNCWFWDCDCRIMPQ